MTRVQSRHPPIRPRKSLGQHFLRDENITRKIVAAAAVQPGDVVLEIGPGEGALTRHLAPLARKLVLVDLDARVTDRMKEEFPAPSVGVVTGDVLEFNIAGLAGLEHCRVRIIGNIPYNITSPILFHLLDNSAHIADATLMIQKEVARRLVAVPRTKEYGILSVFFQLFTDVALLFDVPPGAFYPVPKVHSSVVHLTMRDAPLHALADTRFFRRMVRSVFGKRRKTLRNSLAYFAEEERIPMPAELDGVDLRARPEELSIGQLAAMANTLWRCSFS